MPNAETPRPARLIEYGQKCKDHKKPPSGAPRAGFSGLHIIYFVLKMLFKNIVSKSLNNPLSQACL
jgi:hypothetical protein